MAEESQKPDPFKPVTPQIPGVPQQPAEPEKPGEGPPKKPIRGLAFLLTAVLVLGVGIAVWLWHSLRASSGTHATNTTQESTSTQAPVKPPPPVVVFAPDSPAEIATAEELPEPWSAKPFKFRSQLTGETLPAIVLRLPGSAESGSSYWAFTLRAPFGNCELEYVTDLGKLTSEYGYAARHPMVVDPCSRTVYDPLGMGTLAGGAWARGEVVKGSGLRPPLAIQIAVLGSRIFAVRSE